MDASSPAAPQAARASAPASLLHSGERHVLLKDSFTIGRLPENDLAISKESVSRQHARIDAAQGGYLLVDLGSSNGTQLNGERFRGESRWLTNGDTIVIGDELLRFLAGEETRLAGPQRPVVDTTVVQLGSERLAIGRDASNGLVLADPNVSRFHAEVARLGDGRVAIRDLGSRNGTRVDGEIIRSAVLQPGSQVGIGPYRLVFDGDALVARSEQGALRLDADGVAIRVGAKQILAETTLSVQPGELVAFIGESGSGKTTLLKALAGVTTPSSGSVRVNGEPVTARLTDIGYLPQDEIVHPALTVRESLRYSARLRLPGDSGAEEIEETVERALEELGLTAHGDTRIGALSGGQRKRVGLATEILSRPSLLFLDEPTTGLDPGLESRMMALLRELSGRSRAVIVVTHATKSLGLCDRLVVMGRGGVLCFEGSPNDALQFFGVDSHDDIYPALEDRDPAEWQQRHLAIKPPMPPAGADAQDARAAGPARRARASIARQTQILTTRYARLFARDRRNVVILLAQIPVLALAIAGLFKIKVFVRPSPDAGQAVKLTFLLLVTTVWIGMIDASREIIKEKTVFAREHSVGVSLSAYLLSKAAVLFALAAIQALVLTGIVLVFQPLHSSLHVYGTVLAIVVLTAFAAVSMGLLVSAVVRNQDQATSFIPLVLIPQLFFGGSIVAVAQMSAPLQAITKVVVTQWSYAGLGAAIDMNQRIAESPDYSKVSSFGKDYFTLSALDTYLVLVAFIFVFMLISAWRLQRHARS
ncbi:MAG TPA: FHA domain-containing protein [Solirubrobacteraceae bacterium]|jgi:ABC-type multidrug transport system ATPase subunit/ABC-type multidrug transport system permease subunit|nr:FHA domain-containing protein [Solirubrobacteraceae bacterium]